MATSTRFCSECGNGRRMLTQPEGETLCGVCAGTESHGGPASGERVLMRMMVGALDSPDAYESLTGAQGGSEVEGWIERRRAAARGR